VVVKQSFNGHWGLPDPPHPTAGGGALWIDGIPWHGGITRSQSLGVPNITAACLVVRSCKIRMIKKKLRIFYGNFMVFYGVLYSKAARNAHPQSTTPIPYDTPRRVAPALLVGCNGRRWRSPPCPPWRPSTLALRPCGSWVAVGPKMGSLGPKGGLLEVILDISRYYR
jgi:hypothetical protein